MDLASFEGSLGDTNPPPGLSAPVTALWFARTGDWDRAHAIVQDDDGEEAAWVHAYLHRDEGDLANAGYWYRRAGKPVAEGSLEDEWRQISIALLAAA